MATMTPDAQLLQRIQQAVTLRDKSRDTEIQMRTAANIARQQADVAKAQALELFGVNSLEELQAKAAATYKHNVRIVADFEAQVQEYVTSVTEANALGEASKV